MVYLYAKQEGTILVQFMDIKQSSETQNFKRARNDAQKQLRITQFLDTAAKLYEEEGYEKVSLSQIAKELNFHRNNVYNYFNCKEDLFLFLLLRDLDELIADVCDTHKNIVKDYHTFAINVTETILRHPRLPELFGLANTTMLLAASDNIIRKYRLRLIEKFNMLEQYLQEHAFPNLSLEEIHTLTDYITVQAIALYPASMQYKERHHIKIFQEKDLRAIDFRVHFPEFVETMLRGFKQNK